MSHRLAWPQILPQSYVAKHEWIGDTRSPRHVVSRKTVLYLASRDMLHSYGVYMYMPKGLWRALRC